ncbi:MAG: CBS domain-containing protein [Acidobacteria bacterium]|nr:CBS domain-containing protein [Acidobacteriota bacterium]
MTDSQPPDRPRPRLRDRLRAKTEARTPTEFEQAVIRRVHEAAQLELRDVMTPRVDVVYLEHPVTPEQVAEAVRESGHSAFPVATEDLDDVDGVLLVNDLFRSSNRRRGFGVALPDITEIERKIRRPFVLPETMEVFEALEEMRKNHRTFAIVVDEHGGVAGVVSTRDLLEPLVGDLSDEYDEEEADEISLISTGRWLIQGQVHVDTVEEVTGIALPEGEYVTIGGFLMEQFDKVPTQGEVLTWKDWTFTVYRTEKRRVLEVIVAGAPVLDEKAPSGEGGGAE